MDNEDDITISLRWHMARRWIDAEIESDWGNYPDAPKGDWHRGMAVGYNLALMKIKSMYFFTDEEDARSWKMRKEMGF